jgi:carbonic anhydrase
MDIIYRFDPYAPIEIKHPKTNREALKVLAAGNSRFAKMVEHIQKIGEGNTQHPPMVIPVNPVTLGVPIVSGLEPAHNPFALVLGCADARVPIEHVLDCSANNLFVVRVAGNVLGLECVGSVDYAATALRQGLQSVIVMGHTGCGAVTAAVDIYLSPTDFRSIAFTHPLRSMLDRLQVAVRGSAKALERICGTKVHKQKHYREWLITTSIYMNAAITALDLEREVDAVSKGLSVSYTVYDMAWTRIGALPFRNERDFESTPAFAPSAKDAEDFNTIAEGIIARLRPGT